MPCHCRKTERLLLTGALERDLDALVKDAAGKLRVQRKIENHFLFLDRLHGIDECRSCAGMPAISSPLKARAVPPSLASCQRRLFEACAAGCCCDAYHSFSKRVVLIDGPRGLITTIAALQDVVWHICHDLVPAPPFVPLLLLLDKIIMLPCMVCVTIVLPEHAEGSFGFVKLSRTYATPETRAESAYF